MEKSNQFYSNEGPGTCLLLYNKFDKLEEENAIKIMEDNKGSLIFSDCSFEIKDSSNCCVFYLKGYNGVPIEMSNCDFLFFK